MTIQIKNHKTTLPNGYAVNNNEEILVIGDVHGCAKQLEGLLECFADLPLSNKPRTIVYLGDLIDRGPESLRSLDLAIHSINRKNINKIIGLAGNHENMMRLALSETHDSNICNQTANSWIANGGANVISEIMEINPSLSEINNTLGVERQNWLNSLTSHYKSGNVMFIHAGINPHISLNEFLSQPWDIPLSKLRDDFHWAWIREPFLSESPTNGFHNHFVIHGHSIIGRADTKTEQDQIKSFRLNLDGGSFHTGIVRAAWICDSDITVFEATSI